MISQQTIHPVIAQSVLERTNQVGHEEQILRKPWSSFNSNYFNYVDYFADIFNISYREMSHEMPKNINSILVLAGQPNFVRTYPSKLPGHSLAVSLGESRTLDQILKDEENLISAVSGDLQLESTWDKVVDWKIQNDVTIDLIVSRPYLGWSPQYVTCDIRVYYELFIRTASLCSVGTHILSEIPYAHKKLKKFLPNFRNHLEDLGFEVKLVNQNAFFVKRIY